MFQNGRSFLDRNSSLDRQLSLDGQGSTMDRASLLDRGSVVDYDTDYWPQWDSNYAPATKNNFRPHHRNAYAPTSYTIPAVYSEPFTGNRGVTYPRQRQTLLDTNLQALSSISQQADSLFPTATTAGLFPALITGNLSVSYGVHARGYSPPEIILPLSVTCEVKSTEATIQWNTSSMSAYMPAHFNYYVYVETGDKFNVYNLPCWKTHHTTPVAPGTYYNVKVEAETREKVVVARGTTEFKAVFDKYELQQVYYLAVVYVKPLNARSAANGPIPGSQRFEIFYRNKPTAYFDTVRYRDGGIMIKYRKDDNGHPASPINGEIDGLFFNSRLPGGTLPKTSPFGNVRISIPAEYLFTPKHNLYFCDFYCNNSTHYVTVVACLPNSTTDLYCSRYLLPLNPMKNIFIFVLINPLTCQFEYFVNSSIWVEFYYTEDVPISWGTFDNVPSTGQSKPNGVPNNKYCTICNLYPLPSTSSARSSSTSSSSVGTASPFTPTPVPTGSEKRPQDYEDPLERKKTKKEVTSADFVISKNETNSTLVTAVELQKEKCTNSGERLECADPAIIDVVCSLVDEVVNREEVDDSLVKRKGIESSSNWKGIDSSSNWKGIDSSSNWKGIDSSNIEGMDPASSKGEGFGSSSSKREGLGSSSSKEEVLVDVVHEEKTCSLKEFRAGQNSVSRIIQTAEQMLVEARKSADGLSKKLAKR